MQQTNVIECLQGTEIEVIQSLSITLKQYHHVIAMYSELYSEAKQHVVTIVIEEWKCCGNT